MLSENRFLKHFRHIPIGVTGIGLGIGGLGNLYAAIFSQITNNILHYSIIQIICTFFTISFLILIFLRNLAHKNTFTNEIKHPLLSSFIPTICMSSMIVSGFFGVIGNIIDGGVYQKISNTAFIFKAIGVIIWYLATIFHVIFLGLFFYHVFLKHDKKNNNLFASWFVPPVGIIVSCTVVGYFNGINWIPNIIQQIVWYFGFSLYMITLPYISYKLLVHKDFTRQTLPSFAIFGAPANLSLVGFYGVFINGDYPEIFKTFFISFLTILGLITTTVLYVMLFWIFKIKFNPTYASLTFPLAIGSTAMFKSYNYFLNINFDIANLLQYISYFETAIATIIIVYVLIRMNILILKKIKQKID